MNKSAGAAVPDNGEDGRSWTARELQAIKTRAMGFGLNGNEALNVIERATSLDHATDMLQDMAARKAPRRTDPKYPMDGDHTFDNPAFFVDAVGEALYARVNPGHKFSEQAREFAGIGIRDAARLCVERNGGRVSRFGTSGAMIDHALSLRTGGLHTTSDFSAILGNTINRSLRRGYLAVNGGLRIAAAQRSNKDFRAAHRVLLDSTTFSLEKVTEHGEFTRATMADSKESITLETFGRVFGISRQALVNDDLGAFDEMPRHLGQAAANFEAGQLVALLLKNAGAGPTMDDTKALFHADHSNLAVAGTAITEAALSDARKAMRKQKGKGSELVSVTPKWLVVSPDKETEAEKIVSIIQAAKTDDTNVFTKLAVLVEPRLSGNRWYLAADTAEIDGLTYAYLEGEEGPQFFTRDGFDVDGVEFKVRLDYGAGFEDWRGWYSNPGA